MTTEEFIAIIDYNQEWFSFNFIPDEFIQLQMNEWESSGDHNIEHYKWGAYQYILSTEDFSKIDRLNQFIQLIENDPNEHLYKGALSILASQGHISKDRLSSIRKAIK